MQSFTSQIFGVVSPLQEDLDFFSPLGFDVQTNSDHKTQKIKLYSVRAFKGCLNEKNLIHGRVMSTISKFSPQVFETYFGLFFTSLQAKDGKLVQISNSKKLFLIYRTMLLWYMTKL